MSFSRGSFTTSTPVQQPSRSSLYPSLNLQTPATPTPSNPPSQQQQQQQQYQPLQQKPPPRPASVPLSFGGGLSHSASTPSLSQAFQNNVPTTQQQQDPFSGTQQPFSPAPQPPLTTFDLSGSSPFVAKQGLQWGGGAGQLGGHGLTRSHSQQFMPQPLGGGAAGGGNPLVGERRYLPSHLRSYSPERSSPLAKEQVTRDPMPSPKEKRRVSFGSVTTFGHPSTSNFGGAGFGTPKDDGKSKSRREEDDLPPAASVYDFTRSSPFSKQDSTTTPHSPSPPPDITPSLFGSAPLSSPPKRLVDPTPVIIFGFPSSHSLLIIREYEKYGQILEHFTPSPHQYLDPYGSAGGVPTPEILHGGNWIRVTYADPVSAARAVATNGMTMGGAYMIGVIYAPKTDQPASSTATNGATNAAQPTEKEGDVERTPATPSGERKMNVVRGGQSMFARKESAKPAVTTAADGGWGTWVWNQIVGGVGAQDKKDGTAGTVAVVSGGGGDVVAGGGGQSNVVVRALKGLSETVFGF